MKLLVHVLEALNKYRLALSERRITQPPSLPFRRDELRLSHDEFEHVVKQASASCGLGALWGAGNPSATGRGSPIPPRHSALECKSKAQKNQSEVALGH